MFLFGRITVPRGTEEQRRSVPFQLLLLLERMQDSRQKAVQPMELAYCLQKYNVPSKIAFSALKEREREEVGEGESGGSASKNESGAVPSSFLFWKSF